MNDLESRLLAGLAEMEIPSDDSLLKGLLAYLRELTAWNKAYNLTAVRDPLEMVSRHLLDSLSILPWVSGERLLDVGTGAGLPGIPLALARPQGRYTLLDSNGKKIRFLRHIIRTLGLDHVEAVQARVETFEADPYACVTARAFAAVDQLLAVSGHLVGGRVLAMRGRDEQMVIPEGYVVTGRPELKVPGLDSQRRLLIIERHV